MSGDRGLGSSWTTKNTVACPADKVLFEPVWVGRIVRQKRADRNFRPTLNTDQGLLIRGKMDEPQQCDIYRICEGDPRKPDPQESYP